MILKDRQSVLSVRKGQNPTLSSLYFTPGKKHRNMSVPFFSFVVF